MTEALINVLGVTTWYLIGIAYVSTASRYWPYKEQFRGKWLPWDIREAMESDPDAKPITSYPESILAIVIPLAFLMTLTIWPVLIYSHAKRGFRTKPGNHTK